MRRMAKPARVQLLPEVLDAANLDECLPLWGGAGDYADGEFELLVQRVRGLLSEDRARGRLLRDDTGRVRAFGVAVFVEPAVSEALLTNAQPHVGRRLLQLDGWEARILTDPGVARGNAGDGLQAVVVNQGYDDRGLSDDDWAVLLGTLIQAFIDAHAGFNLARIVIEAFGTRGAEYIARSWNDLHRFELTMRNGVPLSTAVWAVTRAEAERQGGALLPMFLYRPPRLMLTAAERAVLRIALSGAPDPVISRQLGLAKPALTARWSRIFRRWADSKLEPQLQAHVDSGKRGSQIRHVVVDYVRRHPSELTPFAARSAERAVTDGSRRSPSTPS